MITAEQFYDWKEHPVTKEVFKELRDVHKNLQERLISGQTVGENAEYTHGQTHRLVGHLEGLNQLLNITCTDMD